MKNREIMKELNMKESTFYHFKKRLPRVIDLVIKGLQFEKILKDKK